MCVIMMYIRMNYLTFLSLYQKSMTASSGTDLVSARILPLSEDSKVGSFDKSSCCCRISSFARRYATSWSISDFEPISSETLGQWS